MRNKIRKRIKLYQKIHKRNPHLWDINEYQEASYWPYEALELKKNPKLIVFIKDFRVVKTDFHMYVHEPIEPSKQEIEDMEVVWDFFKRCFKNINELELKNNVDLKKAMDILRSIPRDIIIPKGL